MMLGLAAWCSFASECIGELGILLVVIAQMIMVAAGKE
jgi:hypothetical protein